MGLLQKEEFANVGTAREFKCGKDSTLVLQWRMNVTKRQYYLSIGKKVKYATMENGEAVMKETFKAGVVVPQTEVKQFLETVALSISDMEKQKS
jgi:hypothetical protein